MIVYWMSDFSTGDLTEWTGYGPDPYTAGGGPFNSGVGIIEVVNNSTYQRSGAKCANFFVESQSAHPSANAIRLFRTHLERQRTAPYPPTGLVEGWFSCWYNFPQKYIVPVWENLMQFKSYNNGSNDPTIEVNVFNRGGTGNMYIRLYNKITNTAWTQTIKDIVPGQLTHVEVHFKASNTTDGFAELYQDNVLLTSVKNIQTTYNDSSNGGPLNYGWSCNHYPDDCYLVGESPTGTHQTNHYIDDAAITSERVGDLLLTRQSGLVIPSWGTGELDSETGMLTDTRYGDGA